MTWPKNSTASSSVVVFRRPAGLRRASGIGRRATLRRASGACRLARLMLAGGAPFGDGLVCRGPVGGGHLAEHDPDAGRVGADRRDHGRVQPVDQVAQQVGRAALDQRDLHEGHHRLPRNTEPRLVKCMATQPPRASGTASVIPPVSTIQPASSATPRLPRSLTARASASAGCPCTAAPVAESTIAPPASTSTASIARSSDWGGSPTGPVTNAALDALSATTSGSVNLKSLNRLSMISAPP